MRQSRRDGGLEESNISPDPSDPSNGCTTLLAGRAQVGKKTTFDETTAREPGVVTHPALEGTSLLGLRSCDISCEGRPQHFIDCEEPIQVAVIEVPTFTYLHQEIMIIRPADRKRDSKSSEDDDLIPRLRELKRSQLNQAW